MKIKNILFFIFLFSLIEIAKSDDLFDDDTKIILVHVSNVLAENNIKVAGTQLHSMINRSMLIEPEGTNLRRRITLHHCLGGMVPNTSVGLNMGDGIVRSSHLNIDRNVCAYLDSLRSFSGEVFGGRPDDFMTIDRHTYGESSTIIVSIYKIAEFRYKNPNYKGRLIIYDPDKISLRKKVEEVIEETTGSPQFSNINKSLKAFTNFCIKHLYSNKGHEHTPFMLLENATEEFHKTIYQINLKCKKPGVLLANQVKPLLTIVHALLNYILQELEPILSEEKIRAVRNWVVDIKNWGNLFQVDADLRLNKNKSLFINNPFIYECINNRNNVNYLYNISDELPLILADSDLKKVNKKRFLWQNVEEISEIPTSFVIKLRKKLMKKGYVTYEDEFEALTYKCKM